MKRVLSVTLATLLLFSSISLVFTLPASSTTINLISNGNFASIPTGTSFTSDAGTAYPGRILAYSAGCSWYRATLGNGMAFDAYTTENANTCSKIAQNIGHVVSLTSNTTYTLSFKAKRDSVFFSNPMLTLGFVDRSVSNSYVPIMVSGGTLKDESGNTATGNQSSVNGVLTANWQTFTFSFTTGTVSGTAQYALYMYAPYYTNPTTPADAKYWYMDDVALVPGSISEMDLIGNRDFQTSTGNIGTANEISNISADGDCLDGVTGHSDVGESRIIARPTTLTDDTAGLWYRASIGRTKLLLNDGVNAYSAIVEEAGNSTNHIAKVGQSIMQGIKASPNETYTVSYDIRLKQGITLPSTATYITYLMEPSGTAVSTNYTLSLDAASISYTDANGVYQVSENGVSLVSNNTLSLNLKTIESIVNSRWVTVSYTFKLNSSTFTKDQLLWLTFLSTNWNVNAGNASNFFEYMDNVSVEKTTDQTMLSLDFDDGTNSPDAKGFTTDLASVASSTYTGVPAACGGYVGSFASATAYNNTTYPASFNVTSGSKYQASCWINVKSATVPGSGSYFGASFGVVNTQNSLGSSSTSAASTYTIYNASGTQIATGTGGLGSGKSYFSLLQQDGRTFDTWYYVVLKFTATATEKEYFMLRTENITNANVLVDEVKVQEVIDTPVTVDCKESAAVIPTSGKFTTRIGDSYSFTVLSADTAPTVTYNNVALTPVGGVYSFTATTSNVVKVVCVGDTGLPNAGYDEYGNNLTTYANNPAVYLKNIWSGTIAYHETAMFYSGRTSLKLLYPIDDVVSLRSYDLKTYYVKGVDYNIVNGEIQRTANSRIPVYASPLTTTTNTGWPSDTAGTYINVYGDTAFPATGLCITYKHTTTWSGGYTGTSSQNQTSDLTNTMAKLAAGQPVNIVIYGDSISCGWSSSGLNNPNTEFKVYNEDCTTLATTSTGGSYVINVAPYAPTWVEMFVWALRAKYPGATINVTNLSLGGKASYWGREQIATRLANLCTAAPDLVLMGWGVNDSYNNGCAVSSYKTYCQGVIDIIRNPATVHGNPNAEVLLYSPMLPNTDLACYDKTRLLDYENALNDIASASSTIGLVKLTSIYNDVCNSKGQVDYLNTNLNHPNDFGARIYATSILNAMGY